MMADSVAALWASAHVETCVVRSKTVRSTVHTSPSPDSAPREIHTLTEEDTTDRGALLRLKRTERERGAQRQTHTTSIAARAVAGREERGVWGLAAATIRNRHETYVSLAGQARFRPQPPLAITRVGGARS